MEYGSDIYLLSELDTVIVAVQRENELYIPYLNTPANTSFSRICELLPFTNVEKIYFGFTPDALGVSYQWEKRIDSDLALFIRGDLKFIDKFVFPALSKT